MELSFEQLPWLAPLLRAVATVAGAYLLGRLFNRFLARHLPEIEEHLHYRSIDVSSVKELARRWYPTALADAPSKSGGHRALDDIRESVAELRYWRSAIFKTP